MSMDDARMFTLHHLLRQACELLASGDTAATRLKLSDALAVLHGSKPLGHSDEVAVDQFATAMKAKLMLARAKGRHGWETCAIEILQESLMYHVAKGDPVDVGNFAMMVWSRGQRTVLDRHWVNDFHLLTSESPPCAGHSRSLPPKQAGTSNA